MTALRDALGETRRVFGHVGQSPASPEAAADDGTRSQTRSVSRSQENPNHGREVGASQNGVRPLSNISALSNDSNISSATVGNSRSVATVINSASDNSIMQADYIPLCEADAEADKADENDEEVVSEEE